MNGYLLDTNAVSDWYAGNQGVRDRIASLPEGTPVRISAITRGEIEFGNELGIQGRDQEVRDAAEKWLRDKFPNDFILKVDRHTGVDYGRLKAKLVESMLENGDARDMEDAKSKILVFENDLWIAAQAVERGLILVTNDPDFEQIKAASIIVHGLPLALRCEDWRT